MIARAWELGAGMREERIGDQKMAGKTGLDGGGRRLEEKRGKDLKIPLFTTAVFQIEKRPPCVMPLCPHIKTHVDSAPSHQATKQGDQTNNNNK